MRAFGLFVCLTTAALPLSAAAARPSPAEIEARLFAGATPGASLIMAPGDTRFVRLQQRLPRRAITRNPLDYELVVTANQTPRGVELSPRAYRFQLIRQGDQYLLQAQTGLFVKPGARDGGPVSFTAVLRERRRPSRVAARIPTSVEVRIRPTVAQFSQLETDFWGYRAAREQALKTRAKLAKARIQVDKRPERALPSLKRRRRSQVALLLELNEAWQRMGVAKRHLIAATQGQKRPIVATAFGFLENLDREPSEFMRLPTAEAEATLAPSAQIAPEPPAPPPEPKKPAAPKPKPARSRPARVASAPRPYPRPLTLDDPNIGYTAGLRMALAPTVRIREDASVLTAALFGQVALNEALSITLALPVQRVAVRSIKPKTPPAVTGSGNPEVGARWRLSLPALLGLSRPPALSLRAGWALPLPRSHLVPTSDLSAEDFTLATGTPRLADFMMNKHGLKAGASLAWAWSAAWYSTVQLDMQAFLPTPNALDQRGFTAIHYGLSGGWRPLDWLGLFAEARGQQLLTHGARGELLAYLGARAHFAPGWEPALWVATPLGPARAATKLQLGLELRFAYDLSPAAPRRRARRTP